MGNCRSGVRRYPYPMYVGDQVRFFTSREAYDRVRSAAYKYAERHEQRVEVARDCDGRTVVRRVQ